MGLLDKFKGSKKQGAGSSVQDAKQSGHQPEPEAPARPRPSPPPEKDFSMSAKRGPNGTTLILVLKGRLDVLAAPDFDQGCEKLISKGEKDFLVEMSGVTFVASAGLRSIMSLSMRLRALEGNLAFCNVPQSIDSVFQLAGMKKMFPMYPRSKRPWPACRSFPCRALDFRHGPKILAVFGTCS